MSRIIRNKGLLKIVCLTCLASSLGIDASFAGVGVSRSGILTNFQIIEMVSSDTAKDVIARIGALPQEGIVLLDKAKSAGSVDFVLENSFVREMRDAGLSVAVEAPKKDEAVGERPMYKLSYQIVRLSLAYPQTSRKLWLGPLQVRRAAQADVFVQFIDAATGDVLWVKDCHKEYKDTITGSQLKEVEDPQYDFTRPPHSEFKMVRLFEPIVVGGIVVGLVYLFFSNQSD
ncbi:MAG: hypothetical protein PHD74_00460 [Candidatus Krumholzibacteria bacterium]|nr:hypothetical protein [Candidatus Krumholzibacteria bacterium]